MKCKLNAFGIIVLPLLGGCATYGSVSSGKFDQEEFGEANRQTYAAMIVDPDPQYETDIEGRAQQGTDAIERVRDGQAKTPVSISTTDGPGR